MNNMDTLKSLKSDIVSLRLKEYDSVVDTFIDYDKLFGVSYITSEYKIKNVIFNGPATIVFWEDGTKTVVNCQDGDEFDAEKAIAMCYVKKIHNNKSRFNNYIKKWLPKED